MTKQTILTPAQARAERAERGLKIESVSEREWGDGLIAALMARIDAYLRPTAPSASAEPDDTLPARPTRARGAKPSAPVADDDYYDHEKNGDHWWGIW